MGTIVTGSSDSSIKTSYLVAHPERGAKPKPPTMDLTFREMLEVDLAVTPDSASASLDYGEEEHEENEEDLEGEREKLVIETGRTCYANCVCPPGYTKPKNMKCARCWNRGHTELVRTLHMGENVILSGSYDMTVKVGLYQLWRCRE